MPALHPREGLGDLLVAFLRGDAAACEQFPRVARPILLKLARYHGSWLPEDLQREVVCEAELLLLRRKARSFDPARGPARTYLRFVVREAVRRVGALYTPPGCRSRERGTAAGGLAEYEAVPAPGAELVPEHRCDARTILERAPAHVAYALERVHFHRETMAEIAAEGGMTRFGLTRDIDRYGRTYRAA
jgi:hypothetical protein